MNDGVQHLPPPERPRERLLARGPGALSLVELVALVIGSGARGASALAIARRLVNGEALRVGLDRAGVHALIRVPGLGVAGATRLVAAVELGRRLVIDPLATPPVVADPDAAARLVAPVLQMLSHEELHALLLDARRRHVGTVRVATGGLERCGVRPADVFRPAVEAGARYLVLAHNHPSGDPTPSAEDAVVTRILRRGGELLGVELLDHLVVGRATYRSLRGGDWTRPWQSGEATMTRANASTSSTTTTS